MPVAIIRGGGGFTGTLRVPGDKSVSHRAVLLSALADGTSRITGLSAGADVAHTLAAVTALGAGVRTDGAGVQITGGRLHEPDAVLDVGNSGTGIRLLSGVLAGLDGLSVLQGDTSIAARPMDRLAVPLRAMGAWVDGRDGGRYPPLVIRGGALRGIDYAVPVASAQVKSAILLAGLSAIGETTVREPAPTRAHTEEMLLARGADLAVDGALIRLRPGALKPLDEDVPGDPSQAAFWLVGAAVTDGGDVTVENLYLGPARGGFLNVLRRMGARVEVGSDPLGGTRVRVRGARLRGTDIAPEEIAGLIDEVPALAVAAALANGSTTIRGAAELRVKESDRIAATVGMLRAFGASAQEAPDGLSVTGGRALHAAEVRSHSDHRIAMAAAIAAVHATGSSRIDDFDAVATSYPGFLDDLAALAPRAEPQVEPTAMP